MLRNRVGCNSPQLAQCRSYRQWNVLLQVRFSRSLLSDLAARFPNLKLTHESDSNHFSTVKILFCAAALQVACLTSSKALIIALNPVPGMDANALSGFQSAANYWQSKLADNVTVNINVGFSALGPGILGSAGSTSQVFSVANTRNALINDASTATDILATANLSALSGAGGMGFFTQVNSELGSTVVSFDNDNSNNNRFLDLNTANAKALGLLGATATPDASITFSSSFSWDFDQSNGVGAGLQDFVGVAIHEIGHALGFVSGVDIVDAYIGDATNLDNFAIFSTLDMFRYSSAGDLNLAAGAAAYFSLDGGITSLGGFSTGSFNGDGRQASHWKDNLGLGIMDPTANPAGQINTPSALDLVAFDAIGWDLIPEPSSALLGILGSLLALCRRRR